MANSSVRLSKVKTIGQFGIQFGSELRDLDSTYREAGDILYRGLIDKAIDKVWQSIAPIHENFERYNSFAMATLYKGVGKFRSGTESPKLAVLSILSKKEIEFKYEYVIIWRIVTPNCFIDRENFQTVLRCMASGDKQIYRSTEGKFAAEQAKAFVPSYEKEENTVYRLIPIKQAIMESLYDKMIDMSSDELDDWNHRIYRAFRFND